MSTSTNALNPTICKPDKKYPLRFTWISLIFIYLLQYPLSQLLEAYSVQVQYGLEDWLIAYAFVIISALVFVASLYIGLSGTPIRVHATSQLNSKPPKLGLMLVLFAFALFFFWSYLMLNLKIGMTIYADFDPLPFRLTGLLFYGRLFIQPLVLFYIARAYVRSKLKFLIFLLMIALGAWATLTSGSRFVGIMFALPLLFLFDGTRKYIVFAIVVLSYIIIATLSRNFYLPFQIGGEYIEIYAGGEYQAAVTENILLLPISYIIGRSMGMAEVLLTLNFGAITPSLLDSFLSFFSYFLPFVPQGNSVSIKNIYGLDDATFGGFGLDMFSNYWVFFGGNLLLYGLGLALIGWMLGKTHRLFTIALTRFGLNEGSMLIFILLFILVFEGRGFVFPSLLLTAWLCSRKTAPRIVFSALKSLTPKRVIRSLDV